MSFLTIGVHGKAISPLVPLPSRLSEESIQLGIVSAGAIKASLYTDGDVLIRPQVFGHKPEAKCRGVGTSTSHGSTALAVEAQPNHTPLRD